MNAYWRKWGEGLGILRLHNWNRSFWGLWYIQTGAQDESFTNDTPTKIGCPSGWRERGVCIILCNIPKINTKCVECVELQTWFLSRKKECVLKPKFFQSVEKRWWNIPSSNGENVFDSKVFSSSKNIVQNSFRPSLPPQCLQKKSTGGIFFRNKILKEDGFWKINLLFSEVVVNRVYKGDGDFRT